MRLCCFNNAAKNKQGISFNRAQVIYFTREGYAFYMNNKCIGFFDSGVGGLSVLRTALATLPEESFLYYGDTLNAPYGSKEPEEIRELTRQGLDYLVAHGAKALVIACNTATSAAVEQARNVLQIPVISMEPAIKPALAAVSGPVLMMATPATVERTRYRKLLDTYDTLHRVINLPCPYLASQIERNLFAPARINRHLKELLTPYKEVEAVVLGCTHYVLVKDMVQKLLPQAKIFDGNQGTVNRLAAVLQERNIRSNGVTPRTVELYSTDSDQRDATLELYRRILYNMPEIDVKL